jgi:hypothetical protein
LLRYQERDALLEVFQRYRHKVRHVHAAAGWCTCSYQCTAAFNAAVVCQ